MTSASRMRIRIPPQAVVLAFLLMSACFLLRGSLGADEISRIRVFPERIELAHGRAATRVVVSAEDARGRTVDVTGEATFRVRDELIARGTGRNLRPVANGKTELVVVARGFKVVVPIEVTHVGEHDPVSFTNEVVAALTKHECNSGGCHGAPSGKGGFRLSLWGYDPALDLRTLRREHFGRRTNSFAPAESLLLLKPQGRVTHGGGLRLRPGQPAYDLLERWITEGSRADPPSAPRCVGIEVYPDSRAFERTDAVQQLAVFASFSDGTRRDVTPLVRFASSDDGIAAADANGLVTARAAGEVAVLVQYLEHAATSRLRFLDTRAPFEWTSPPVNNYVDEQVFAKLRAIRITPSDLCTDSEFVRRVHLDLVGRLPTPYDLERFHAREGSSRAKRDGLIDELLAAEDHAAYWAGRWADLLRVTTKHMSAAAVHKLHRWLVRALRENMPYDAFARALIAARGDTGVYPPANYYRAAGDTDGATETTAQVFFGARLQCAKCHNHPYERWTQDNYYGLSAFFARVKRTAVPGTGEQLIWFARSGEVTQPRTGKIARPWLPFEGETAIPAGTDPRKMLVDWLTRTDNPFFARVEVNRLWSQLFGRGIVEPIDDFRISNPAVNEPLLDALARDFVEHDYDRRHIVRTILRSRTYQLSSRATAGNARDEKYFSHARVRPLEASQLLEAICQVTGVPESYDGLPEGTRPSQIPSPEFDSGFLRLFGQPARETACACERRPDSDLARVLAPLTGELVHAKLSDGRSVIHRLVAAGASDRAILDHLYTAAYARRPNDAELTIALKYLASSSKRVEALEDLLWTVLNSKAFLFSADGDWGGGSDLGVRATHDLRRTANGDTMRRVRIQ